MAKPEQMLKSSWRRMERSIKAKETLRLAKPEQMLKSSWRRTK
ncbi:hypothetical protein [Enterococcus sp. S22(2020)]|nr:hypothetical protein [Enterococcus sp. S22(2020)]